MHRRGLSDECITLITVGIFLAEIYTICKVTRETPFLVKPMVNHIVI
jgi:hypothetical protein